MPSNPITPETLAHLRRLEAAAKIYDAGQCPMTIAERNFLFALKAHFPALAEAAEMLEESCNSIAAIVDIAEGREDWQQERPISRSVSLVKKLKLDHDDLRAKLTAADDEKRALKIAVAAYEREIEELKGKR